MRATGACAPPCYAGEPGNARGCDCECGGAHHGAGRAAIPATDRSGRVTTASPPRRQQDPPASRLASEHGRSAGLAALNGAPVPAKIAATTQYTTMMTPDEQLATFGFHILSGGDAVPGGYNQTLTAIDPRTRETMGSISINSESAGRTAVIADITVSPAHRGKGVATNLLQAARAEMNDYTIQHGMQTDEGAAWVSKLPAELRRSAIPPLRPEAG